MAMTTAAIGMFDGVHRGHQALAADVMRLAQSQGTESAIFTFDRHPQQTICPDRAPRLLSTPEQRVQWLQALGIDHVHVLTFDQDLRGLTAQEFMRMLRRDYGVSGLVIGFNHRFGHDRPEGLDAYRQIGASVGINVVQGDEARIDGCDATLCSSTIRQDLADGRLSQANAMLGRKYAIDGIVEHGQGVGRTLGFPTANLRPLMSCQLVPQDGVYATLAWVPGREAPLPAMTNIGTRPTIAGLDGSRTIETNIIGYDGDLYGKAIRLEFAHRLRDEQRFDSAEALTRQIEQDRKAVLETLAFGV